MKLYRYMSVREFDKYYRGDTIVGKRSYNARTNSEGVCFLGENVNAMEAYKFLNGIVTEQILVEFEVLDDTLITEAWGVYANPYPTTWLNEIMTVKEMNMPFYNKALLKAKRIAFAKREEEAYIGHDFYEKGNLMHWVDIPKDSVWFSVAL